MTNVLQLPQVPALAYVLSVDGDWIDSIFFPADADGTPLDISGISFKVHFRRMADAQILLPMDTATGTLINDGPTGMLSFNSLVSARTTQLPAATCTGDLFAMADGYQLNLSEGFGPLTLTLRGDTL